MPFRRFATPVVLTATMALTLGWPLPTSAETARPQAAMVNYGDWVSRCTTVAGPGGEKVCEAAIGIGMKGTEGLLAQVVIGRPPGATQARLIIQLPNGVFLPAGATLYLDEKDGTGIPAIYVTCGNGCFADAELQGSQLAALRSATGPGRVEFVDGARNRVAIQIPFSGLSTAIEASIGR